MISKLAKVLFQGKRTLTGWEDYFRLSCRSEG
jgi:hypothetical protein